MDRFPRRVLSAITAVVKRTRSWLQAASPAPHVGRRGDEGSHRPDHAVASEALTELLDRHPHARAAFRHLALVERALLSEGPQALEQITPWLAMQAKRQLEQCSDVRASVALQVLHIGLEARGRARHSSRVLNLVSIGSSWSGRPRTRRGPGPDADVVEGPALHTLLSTHGLQEERHD